MDSSLVVIFACLGLMAIITVATMIIVVTRGKSSISIEWINKVLGSLKLKAEGTQGVSSGHETGGPES
ncbi:hypothetical protein ACTWPT_27870 [Nonomuraea sp. 3N208]|uniref:hypothetical protein n=1 Tax=Nonomuraea sp. 3N208 TaxID=3457421 RepID=UPI003FD68CA9